MPTLTLRVGCPEQWRAAVLDALDGFPRLGGNRRHVDARDDAVNQHVATMNQHVADIGPHLAVDHLADQARPA